MNLKYFLIEYLKNRPIFLSLARAKEADLYQQYLPLAKPVLDIGCGDGFFTKTAFGHHEIGLDTPDSRIKEAEKQNVYEKVVTYDGKKIPFSDNYFGSILCNSVLEHVENFRQVIDEGYRVLKPGGRMIVTVMTDKWDKFLFGRLFFGKWYVKFMRRKQVHINLLSYKQWIQAFERAGFIVFDRKGYLGQRTCRWLDVFHYLSIGYLISYKLTKKWMWWPGLVKIFPIRWMENLVKSREDVSKAAGILLVLNKPDDKN